MKNPRRWLGWLGAGYAVVLLALWFGFARAYSLRPVGEALDQATAAQTIGYTRGILDGKIPAPPTALTTGARVWMSVFCKGELKARAALPASAEQWQRWADQLVPLRGDAASACRVKLDVVRREGPLPTFLPALVLGLIPGVDGVGLSLPDRELVLTADDLILAGVFAAHRPLPAIELGLGIDWTMTLRMLATRAGLSADQWRRTPRRVFRFRADALVEPASHEGPPQPLFRTHRLPQPVTPAALRQAARVAGDYLIRHQRDDGRFDYQYDTVHDTAFPGSTDYSYPRHAGATYFLAQLFGASHEPAFREAAARGLRYLSQRHPPGCDRPDVACVGEPDDYEVDLGSTALAVVAAVDYRRATGSDEFASLTQRWANFLLAMQKQDGDFCHLFRPERALRNEQEHLLYYSGEAAFALAKLARDRPEPRTTNAVVRALDHLTGALYANLVGQSFYGEEHWTCLAVDEAWDIVADQQRRRRYGDFCEGFAAFLQRTQYQEGEGMLDEQPDLRGGYGFSPIMAPHTTPVGSRSEAVISCARVARRRGHQRSARAMLDQLHRSMGFLLERQVLADTAYLVADAAESDGAFLMSDVERTVRIDYQQHVGSAMLRCADLLED